MVDYLRRRAIEGPWETSERLLVCVGPDLLSEQVVRVASRLATGLNAGWVAVTAQQASGNEDNPEKATRIDTALRLVERLGGQTERLIGQDLPGEVLRYARRENITQIVVGRSHAGWLATLAGRSLSSAIVRRSANIGVHIVTGEREQAAPRRMRRFLPWAAASIELSAAVVSVAVAVVFGLGLDRWLHLPNLSMIFLTAVLFCALRFGVRSASAGAIIHARRDGADVAIAITDEGLRVKPGDIDRIFEKFYRGGRADGRKAGTGLGLSISRGLIEAMGGTIRAESPAVRRRGLRLIIRLPAADPTPSEERAA